MSWLDALERRAREAVGLVEDPPVLPAAVPRKTVARKPRAEIKTVIVQTAAPMNGDLGSVVYGYYSVSDGTVQMHKEDGSKTGVTAPLTGDPHQIAYRLTRAAALSKSAFDRPLSYGRSSFA